MQSLSESRGGSKVTKPIFSNSIKRYFLPKDPSYWEGRDSENIPGGQTRQSQAKNSHARLVIYLGIASYLTSFSQGKESVGAFFSFFSSALLLGKYRRQRL